MKNFDVVMAFLNQDFASGVKTKNLRIEGRDLMNYNTILAQAIGDGYGNYHYVINVTKYSTSTTTIQNMILNNIDERKILKCVGDIPMGANYLV